MKYIKNNILYLAWLISLVGTLGSLYYSNVLNFAPCVLCWYQRICLYPLVLILGVGILKKDKNVVLYSLPLSIIGLFVSIYQNLLVYKIIPEAAAPCVIGVSCITKYVSYLGFLTIPLMSFFAFLIIIVSLLIYRKVVSTEV